jgi:hypothetical protein
MVDVGISHVLEDCSQTQAQKKCIYLKAHASNGLSSAFSAEIKYEIKIEYGWRERANRLWKALEQMYDSSNSKRSLSSAPKNISSSSTYFDQDQKVQSSVQKEEKVKSASLEKLEGPISQIGGFDFGITEIILLEEEDCSTSSSDDDDNTDDEYDHEELLSEFQKLISKHMKLQKRHGDLVYSHKELMDSCALLGATHEVMVTTVKDS